jgi:2-(1,2-epoxy-1,2-dihydrophenyl)acetyl-CoA isomerase
VVTLNRPDRYNAVDRSLSEGVVDSLRRAGSEARAVVLTGAGKGFCSGADLSDLEAGYASGDGPDLSQLLDEVFHPLIHALIDCAVPTVGALNGVVAGAGIGIALSCDLRVMGEGAYLTSAFTGIGLAPDSGSTWWLTHHLGISRALEITMTNRRVAADEAVALGLATEAVPGEQLLGRATEIASGLADMVPDSLVTTRRLILGAAHASFAEALASEQREQGRLGRTSEHLEGVKAFTEKRKPDFRNA